jgi:hypothetical protein
MWRRTSVLVVVICLAVVVAIRFVANHRGQIPTGLQPEGARIAARLFQPFCGTARFARHCAETWIRTTIQSSSD